MAYTKKTWVNVPDPSKFTDDELNSFPRFDAENMNRIEGGIDNHIKDVSVHNNATDGGGALGESATTASGGAIGKGAKSTVGGGAIGLEAMSSSGGAIGSKATTTSGGAIGLNAKSNYGGAIGSGASSNYGGGAIGLDATSADGGGAIGSEAKETSGGGSIGYKAITSGGGGSVGYQTSTNTGGAVGRNAKSGAGFSGGASALVGKNSEGEYIDAIQLGSGTNKNPDTLQVYNYLLMKADGTVPVERMSSSVAKIQTRTYNGVGDGGYSNPDVTLTFDFVPKIVIIQDKNESGGFSENTSIFMINGVQAAHPLPTYGSSSTSIKKSNVTWDNTSVTFSTSSTALNTSGRTYLCVALG